MLIEQELAMAELDAKISAKKTVDQYPAGEAMRKGSSDDGDSDLIKALEENDLYNELLD